MRFWQSRNSFGQLNNPDLHDDRSQMSKKATDEMSLFFFFSLLIICLIMAVESSNTITARPQSGTAAWKWWQDVATRGTIQSRQAQVWLQDPGAVPTEAAVQPRELISTQPSTSQSLLTEQAYPEQSLTCAQRDWVGSRAAAPKPGCREGRHLAAAPQCLCPAVCCVCRVGSGLRESHPCPAVFMAQAGFIHNQALTSRKPLF